MLWKMQIIKPEPVRDGWAEKDTGRTFEDDGTQIVTGISYVVTDENPAQPGWYTGPPAPPVPPPPSRLITKLAFRDRFTENEWIDIEFASIDNAAESTAVRKQRARLRTMLAELAAMTHVDLDRARLRDVVGALESQGIIAAGRAATILDATVTADEVWHQ